MFERLPSENNSGIERFRNYRYAWETALLKGNVTVFEDLSSTFHLYASPNLGRLRTLDADPARVAALQKPPFDEARNMGIFLGEYPSLDIIEGYIHTLNDFYRQVLSDTGAANRVLRAETNMLKLQPTNQETAPSFGDALRLARHKEVFDALKQGREVSFNQMVGRVFRSFAHTLGVEYSLTEERDVADPTQYKSITFTYNRIGAFQFEKPAGSGPVMLTRYSCGSNGNYHATFEGPAHYENIRRHVFNWLLDAMKEIKPYELQSAEDHEIFVRNRQEAIEQFYHADAAKGVKLTRPGGPVLRLVH